MEAIQRRPNRRTQQEADRMEILNTQKMINNRIIILVGGFIFICSFIIWHELKHPIYDGIKKYFANTDYPNYKNRFNFWDTHLKEQLKFLKFKTPENINRIYFLGSFLGSSLIFLGLARLENHRIIKYFMLFPMFILLFIVFVYYAGNDFLEMMDMKLQSNFFDSLLRTTICIRLVNLMFIIICLIYCISSVRQLFR